MLMFVKQKIKNKIWLSVCLLLGLVSLVAVFCCLPMFKAGSLDKLLDNMFTEYIEENNEYPTVLSRGGAYSTGSRKTVAEVYAGIKEYQATWEKYFSGISVVTTQTRMCLEEETSQGSLGSKGNYLMVSHMPDMLSHVEILAGEDYEHYTGDASSYPCIISQGVMDEYGLVVGETIEFVRIKNQSKATLKLVIAGIFKESDSSDLFWHIQPNEFEGEIFVSESTFNDIVANYGAETIYFNHFTLFDYRDINHDNVDDVAYYTEQFVSLDRGFDYLFQDILTAYMSDRKTIGVILWVLELPMLGMVLAFIYMVSKQIIEAERDEIAMLKSRGVSRKQVVSVYLLQTVCLSVAALVLGIPLGYLMCKLVAGTTDFLTFSTQGLYLYGFEPTMVIYGLIALVIGTVCILLPVIRNSKTSIVERKSGAGAQVKMLWEKYFFDILLLGVSVYLLYNFNKTSENIRLGAMTGDKMDPMIFLDSVLFVAALGLVVLRLIHYLVRLIYAIGKRRWSPAMYASFLQITRTFSRQGFISVFLILTVSLGLFYANTARTINRNNEDRIIYENGADVVVREKWNMNKHIVLEGTSTKVVYDYEEPDYGRYTGLVDAGLCDSVTRVIYSDTTTVKKGSKTVTDCIMQGIHTKEFGETAYLKEELNTETHWYEYLNNLALKQNGVIISRNLADLLEVQVGDNITCVRYSEIKNHQEEERGSMGGQICAIVDAWPGYDRYYYADGEEKENYLVVANYATVVRSYKLSPYEIWYKMSEGVEEAEVYEALAEKNIEISDYNSVDEKIADMKSSPLIQITNGMFTLSFLVATLLCAIGFLIYWISSIRQRELLFGVYRAMGLSVREVNRMLTNEHIFSTLLSVIAGGLVGMAATLMFVRLFGIIYLPERHNLDIYIYFEPGDVIKLAVVIIAMILACMVILRKLIRSMNITQALKLGEE